MPTAITTRRYKSCAVKIKAAGPDDGLQPGQFRALVAVFGNIDSVGDVIIPGAFTDTLAEWKASGNPIPVLWAHDWANPDSHIGVVDDAEQTDDGLEVLATVLDMDTNARAAQVYKLLKGRRVTQFSFAYDIVDGGFETTDGQDAYALRKLTLIEVGPCLLGANQSTDLLDVKAHDLARDASAALTAITADVKAGRVLAGKHLDALKAARVSAGQACDAMDTIITAAEDSDDDTDESKAADESKTGQQSETAPAEVDSSQAATPAKSHRTPAQVRASATARLLLTQE